MGSAVKRLLVWAEHGQNALFCKWLYRREFISIFRWISYKPKPAALTQRSYLGVVLEGAQ